MLYPEGLADPAGGVIPRQFGMILLRLILDTRLIGQAVKMCKFGVH
jgi:hypothetical protein